jgi:hypothetical protein
MARRILKLGENKSAALTRQAGLAGHRIEVTL